MQREDIVRFWGWNKLRRWSAEYLSFLVDVGLPSCADWTLRFDDSEAAKLPRLRNRPHYRRIGFDVDVPICLDEERIGCVLEVGEEFGYPERYFNSNVELFAECLIYYRQYQLAAETGDVDRARVVAATEKRMRETDPRAFGDVESSWPVIIQEMKYGRA